MATEKDFRIKFRRLTGAEGLPLPSKAHAGDAGFDLCAKEDGRVRKCKLVETGFAVAIPEGWVGLLMIRSSVGVKYGVGLANDVGVIDSGYRGEIKVALQNRGDQSYIYKRGDRIAQLVIVPCYSQGSIEVSDLDDTQRGGGGFGSSGK